MRDALGELIAMGTVAMRKISVVIVEDSKIIMEGLRRLLPKEEGIEVVGMAFDGRSGVELVVEAQPDVVVMDIGLPVLNGIDATVEIKVGSPATKVLILSAFDDQENIEAAVNAGADVFCKKDTPVSELAEVIRDLVQKD